MTTDYEKVLKALTSTPQKITQIADEAGLDVPQTSGIINQMVMDNLLQFEKKDHEATNRYWL